MRQAARLAAAPFTICWLTTASPAAETAVVNADEQTAAEELKLLADPTILKSRVWLDSEWNDSRHGGGDGKVTLGGVWVWGVSPNQDWAVRLKIPFAWHVAGNAAGDSDEYGLGDIDLATGAAFRLGKSWRTGGGLELRAPSATDDVLGDDVWRLKPFWSVGWDATERLTFAFTAEYNQSIAEEHGVARKRFLEMFFPTTYVLPHRWSVTAQYEAKVDFENDDRWTHSAKFVVAKRLDRAPVSLAASIKKPFDGGAKQFQVNFIVTYSFD